MLLAYLCATSFWFNAWKTVWPYIPLIPVILAISCFSSTVTGFTTYAFLLFILAKLCAICAPNTEACFIVYPICAWCNNLSFTSYVPPFTATSPPPLPENASILSNGILFLFNASITIDVLYGSCSDMSLNFASLSVSCVKLSLKTIFSSSKTAIFVDVDPGLIVKILFILFLLSFIFLF